MTRAHRLAVALPLVVACALFGATTGQHAFAFLLALVPAASVLRAPRRAMSPPAQALLVVASAMGVGTISALLPVQEGLAARPMPQLFYFGAAGSLLVAGARTHLRDPGRGVPGTLGIGLLAFLGCGSVDAGAVYPSLLALYLGLSFWAIHLCEREAVSVSELGRRHAIALGIVVAMAVATTSALAVALPYLYARANGWVAGMMSNRPISGFRDGPMQLGSLEHMLLSDEIVARVEGEGATHLRGALYDRYHRGRWEPAEGGSSFAIGAGDPLEDDFRSIAFSGGDADRFFLPVGASALHFDPPDARINRLGIARLPVGEKPRSIHYQMGDLPRFSLEAPKESDLQVPDDLRFVLQPLVEDWLAGLDEDSERAVALERRLEAGYVYSVDFQRESDGRDPVLAFLLDDPRGHCEYFAASLTLLARMAGIPARLVTGYRIAERNALGGYFIVRERHAHAWSELYLPRKGWVTVDPSPLRLAGSAASDRTPLLWAALDLGWVTAQRHGRVALLAALVVWFVFIQVRRIWRSREARAGRPGAPLDGPPAYLEEMMNRLAAFGSPRRGEESLEHFARRLAVERARGEPRIAHADELVDRYAALRYGDLGDAGVLERDVRHWLRDRAAADEPKLSSRAR